MWRLYLPMRHGVSFVQRHAVRIKESAVLLGLVIVVVLVVWRTEESPKARFATYGPNLAVDLFSVFVGIFVVARVVRWRRQRELADTRRVAIGRLRRALARFVLVIQDMYVAAAVRPDIPPDSVPALLDAWAAELEHLDFSGKGAAGEPFYLTVTAAATTLDSETTGVVSRYYEALGERTTILVEESLATRCFSVLRQAQGTIAGTIDAVNGLAEQLNREDDAAGRPPRTLRPPSTVFCIFANLEDRSGICGEFVEKLRALIGECEAEGCGLQLASWEGLGRWAAARVPAPASAPTTA